MKEQLLNMKEKASQALSGAGTLQDLEDIRISLLGKKGELTAILRGMGGLSAEERPVIGQLANDVRSFIESEIEAKKKALQVSARASQLKSETIDVTMKGKAPVLGKTHPLTTVLNEVKDIFVGMGFSIVEGPEVEYDYYNFEALNIPADHPDILTVLPDTLPLRQPVPFPHRQFLFLHQPTCDAHPRSALSRRRFLLWPC